MRKRHLLMVEWNDTASSSGWGEEAEDRSDEAVDCVSVGWKLKSIPKHLVITAMRTTDGRCTDRQIIPRGCIRSIRRLE